MSEQIAVGVVGCGNMGGSLAAGVDASEAGRLVAFCDPVQENRAGMVEKYGGRDYAEIEEFLKDEKVEAVVVATPPALHADYTVAAARAGRHVFTEKPMALSTQECARMVETARDAGVALMVGQVLRFYEPFQSIIRWTREGRFGRPMHAEIRRLSGGWFRRTGWRQRLETCGGTLFEVGAHELDFMRCILGDPTQVYGVREKMREVEHEIEDVISLLVRFEEGGSGHYANGTAWGRGRYDMNLCFEEANLISESAFDSSQLMALRAGCKEEEKIALEGFEEGSGVERQMDAWLRALRDGGPVPIPGEEGMKTVELAEAAYRSAETGEVVPLDRS
ncbi:MAG: Gfo/Idh/MocA family oxidoreductase [Planctomycetes bacterium]|nr:Gfo/Idh/MocA family oxidoreductase [Planctomycetota bacterium]